MKLREKVLLAVERMKLREKVLLTTAVFVAIGLGYGLFRYKPRRAEIKRTLAQAQGAADSLRRIKDSGQASPDLHSLRRQLAQLEEKLRGQQKTLAQCRWFAASDRADSAQKLRLAVSELAAATEVRIRESVPHSTTSGEQTSSDATDSFSGEELTSGPFLDPELVRELCADSLQRLVIAAPFTNLREFVGELNRLPWRVTVVDFEIKTIESNASSSNPQPLSATLILAM